MTVDEKKVYDLILEREFLTAKFISEKFQFSEQKTKEILKNLTKKKFIKTDMVDNFKTGRYTKVYRSPISEPLKDHSNVGEE